MPHLQKFEIYDSNTIEFSTMLRIRLAIAAMLSLAGASSAADLFRDDLLHALHRRQQAYAPDFARFPRLRTCPTVSLISNGVRWQYWISRKRTVTDGTPALYICGPGC